MHRYPTEYDDEEREMDARVYIYSIELYNVDEYLKKKYQT